MDGVARHLGDQASRADLDRDLTLLGSLNDPFNLGRPSPLGDVDDAHVPRPGPHQLIHRADAEDDAGFFVAVLTHITASTSRTSASNAAAGSAASRTGRPTTK